MRAFTEAQVYRLAMAAGRDAANRRMAKEGRTVWTDEDYEEAAATFQRICEPRP